MASPFGGIRERHIFVSLTKDVRYKPFPLFMVVMSSKFPTNTDLANPESFLGGNTKLASGHNIFINSSIHNLVLCVSLFKNPLFNIHCRCIDTELKPEQRPCNICMFLHEAHTGQPSWPHNFSRERTHGSLHFSSCCS